MKEKKKIFRQWLEQQLNNRAGSWLVQFGLISGTVIVLSGMFWHLGILRKAWECYAYKLQDEIYDPVRTLLSGEPPRVIFPITTLYITFLILLSDYNILKLRNLPRTLLYFLWVFLLLGYVCTCDSLE